MPTPANHTILVDSNGRPIPQYFVPGVGFKPLKGAGDNGPEYIIKSSALPTGAATEDKQDALIAKDFATQTTLAAILNKIIAAPATEAKQTSIESKIDTIDSVLDGIAAEDFATESTLDEIRNCIYSLLQQAATEDKQDTLIGHVDGVESALASILAKLIAAPATEAKQTALAALIGEVQTSPTANTLLARLKSLEDKIGTIDGVLDAIVDGSAPAATQLTGSNMELYGASINDRPAANTVPAGATFTIVDRDLDQNWISDGTNWRDV